MLVRLFTLLVLVYHVYAAGLCDRKPKGATGNPQVTGNRYRIVIASNPETYNPDQQYTVILQGRSSVIDDPNTFNGFTLTVEPAEAAADITVPLGPLAAGVFKIMPGEVNTKIDENCPNTVVHSSHMFVSKVEVWWKAPEAGLGCVLFRAAVMEQNLWFQNDGGLTLKLCENLDLEISSQQDKCCACNEAKYEMKFEGLWTRQSHPLHFPDNVWLTRFSDVIGASHAADYRIWRVNTSASTGLIEFSENGNTTVLESEIKSNRTRTVIKAKGVMYPNITGKTFAVFRVDPEHHLLSLVSLIKPSPDWFVGLTGFELCENNCTWISERKIDLHPYDLGIWEDINYETRNQRKEEPIRKIDHSNIPDSPFYVDSTEKLKPMARVHLIKSREYEKNENCQTDEATRPAEETSTESSIISVVPQDSVVDEEKLKACTKAEFGPWTNCTVEECDPERVRVQFRQFEESIKEFCQTQNIRIMNEERCEAKCAAWKARRPLPTPTVCPVTPWSPFSECKPKSCRRERKRTLLRDEDRRNEACVIVLKTQILPCSKEECALAKRKPGGRKSPKNKYNVFISASYTYFAEHDASLCANKSLASNKTG